MLIFRYRGSALLDGASLLLFFNWHYYVIDLGHGDFDSRPCGRSYVGNSSFFGHKSNLLDGREIDTQVVPSYGQISRAMGTVISLILLFWL